METIAIPTRTLSREELITGVGGSILVHVLLVAVALLSSWILPGKPLQQPYFSVNLVSLQDLGPGFSGMQKAPGEKGGVSSKASETAAESARPRANSGPVVPVRRLRMAEPVVKTEPEIKKIQGLEAPKVADSSTNAVSLEKNLDKLIAKPKTPPKPAPIVQSEGEAKGQGGAGGKDRTPGQNAGAGRVAGQGGAAGGAEGSPAGSLDGSGRVASALLGMYGSRVKEAINREWAVPDMLKPHGLEARLTVTVNREGKLLNLKVEKTSGNALFDETAIRAVKKAVPLPPFPAVITFSELQIDIRFRPEGLS
ncbi:MAG: TonB C-terminal domain-containing protein [Deltaproteobacteria bacterium]|nr:TonB C-terminal domain-containing protein [Deltaproteobacteria bacterium]